MPSSRESESLGSAWNMVYSHGFGGFAVLLSIVTCILIIVWVLTPAGGGLGLRETTGTTEYFNWHVVLMSAGFLLFMTPATSAFEVYEACSRGANKNIHGALQTAAVCCIGVAYYIIYDCHMIQSDKGLANTMHSISGYITMALVGLTYMMGFTLYVLKIGGSLRGELKPLHKRLGMVSMFMGYATMLMGMTEKANGLTDYGLVFAQVIVGLIIGTTLAVTFSIVKFVDKKEYDFEFKYTSIGDEA
eukprot:CAMPEP_0197027966 /NCGR_PEP_ID=MMETSP1384-20130603/7806_1 /TAXON_ID=29189 /ORGANISM="Ammonia sp." /LENGTH=245 /DNA_ID=CAMNT_0042456901 /DNA_START=110 /DNA_END=843 /DNA_ORIENTATION=+